MAEEEMAEGTAEADMGEKNPKRPDLERIKKLPGYKKFRELIEKLFQFDAADLDFGIYKVLQGRRSAIQEYLEKQLPIELAKEIEGLEQASKAALEGQAEELRETIRRQLPGAIDEKGNLTELGRELKGQGDLGHLIEQYERTLGQLASSSETEAQVNDVLLLVHDFLSRYYDEGDFIPAPRFSSEAEYSLDSYKDPELAPKPDDFAPLGFRGEEIFFHWPTRGMHYVKTDTLLKNYVFRVKTLGLKPKEYEVHFVIQEVEAVKDNNKAKRLLFPLTTGVRLEGSTLTVPFEYRAPREGEPTKQQEAFKEAWPALREVIPDPDLRLTLTESEEGPQDAPLFRKLKHFAALGSKDFFVHPRLKDFLEKELDYFIKSLALRTEEVFASETALAKRVRTLRAFRNIALGIIAFLDQLERVQARLFEKKRFVYRADYVIPIRFVPETLWTEVLANARQLNSWEEELGLSAKNESDLKTHPTLPLSTEFFDEGFKRHLLQSLPFDNLEEATDGLLVHSENYGALLTLLPRYRERVKVIYIDPPYNTKNDDFLYKDGYRHSTWLTMMEERIKKSYEMLSADGGFFSSIDDNELSQLIGLLDSVFGNTNRIEQIIWRKKSGGGQQDHFLVTEHEYILFYTADKRSFRLIEKRVKKSPKGYPELDSKKGRRYKKIKLAKWGSAALREDRPTMYFPITAPDGTEVYPVAPDGRDGRWRYGREKMRELIENDDIHWERNPDGNWVPYEKVYEPSSNDIQILKERSIFYDLVENTEGANELKHLWGYKDPFSNPKPVDLIHHLFLLSLPDGGVALDYFAGSGTTAHAVVSLNRGEGGRRKFILVEMGEHFDTVLLPRIKKVMYSPKWKDGKPEEEPKFEGFSGELPEWVERSPRLVKVLRLESYDDSLFNLSETQGEYERALVGFVGTGPYLMQYFADALLEETPSALGFRRPEVWRNPEAIRLRRPAPGTSNGFVEEQVDWLETAALWLGMRVRKYREIEANARVYRVLEGELGDTPAAIVLRNAEDLSPEEDAQTLEKEVKAQRVIVNAPPTTEYEALEDLLYEALWEGKR